VSRVFISNFVEIRWKSPSRTLSAIQLGEWRSVYETCALLPSSRVNDWGAIFHPFTACSWMFHITRPKPSNLRCHDAQIITWPDPVNQSVGLSMVSTGTLSLMFLCSCNQSIRCSMRLADGLWFPQFPVSPTHSHFFWCLFWFIFQFPIGIGFLSKSENRKRPFKYRLLPFFRFSHFCDSKGGNEFAWRAVYFVIAKTSISLTRNHCESVKTTFVGSLVSLV
jgi:hypothetical protein